MRSNTSVNADAPPAALFSVCAFSIFISCVGSGLTASSTRTPTAPVNLLVGRQKPGLRGVSLYSRTSDIEPLPLAFHADVAPPMLRARHSHRCRSHERINNHPSRWHGSQYEPLQHRHGFRMRVQCFVGVSWRWARVAQHVSGAFTKRVLPVRPALRTLFSRSVFLTDRVNVKITGRTAPHEQHCFRAVTIVFRRRVACAVIPNQLAVKIERSIKANPPHMRCHPKPEASPVLCQNKIVPLLD